MEVILRPCHWKEYERGLAARLILAGNLPADEARKNTASRDRIAEAFSCVTVALLEWTQPDEREEA